MAPGLSLKEIIGVEEKNFLKSYPERGSCPISPRRANASVEFRWGLTIRCVLLYYAAYYGKKQMSTGSLLWNWRGCRPGPSNSRNGTSRSKGAFRPSGSKMGCSQVVLAGAGLRRGRGDSLLERNAEECRRTNIALHGEADCL